MRRQVALFEEMQCRDEGAKVKRHRAVEMLTQKNNIHQVAMACNLSESLVGRLRQAIVNYDNETLDKLINHNNYRRGRHTVRTAAEAAALNNRIKLAVKNGFAADVFTLKSSLRKMFRIVELPTPVVPLLMP